MVLSFTVIEFYYIKLFVLIGGGFCETWKLAIFQFIPNVDFIVFRRATKQFQHYKYMMQSRKIYGYVEFI
jgi:hypothetical protein